MSSSEVYFLILGNWIKKETFGKAPPTNSWWSYYAVSRYYAKAFIVNDKMLACVLNRIYSLDLHTLTWSRLNPKGNRPHKMGTSWLHKGNIYCLDNPHNNTVYCYNTSKNYWERHNPGGQNPSSSSDIFLTISNDDTVFLIALRIVGLGLGINQIFSGLYMFDMTRMHWTKVHDGMPSIDTGGVMSKSSFTFISKSSAVLYGNDNCWLLDVQSAKQLKKPTSIWTQIPYSDIKRDYHAAVFEPKSNKLWIIGGIVPDGKCRKRSSDVIKISFRSHGTLKDLAIDKVIRSMRTDDDPMLLPDQLPIDLKNDIELYKRYNF